MSEHDANRAMLDTARLRIMAEPVEDGKLMTFSERMYRAREAKQQHTDGVVDDAVRKLGPRLPIGHGIEGPTGTRGCVNSVNSDTLVNYGARHNYTHER